MGRALVVATAWVAVDLMYSRPLSWLGWALIACSAATAAEQAHVRWSDEQAYIQVDDCAVVENLGTDTVTEIRDARGDVLRYAGTWMGRWGRYFVLPAAGAVEIEVYNPDGSLPPQEFTLLPCPDQLDRAAVRLLVDALDLRLRGYFGAQTETEAIDDAFNRLFATSGLDALPLWYAVVRYEYASWLWNTGRAGQAESLLSEVQEQFGAIGDARGEAQAWIMLGLIAWRSGHPEQARSHYRRALLIHRNLEDDFAAARIENNLGLIAADEGHYQAALEHYEGALSVFQGEVELRRAIGAGDTETIAAKFRSPAELPAAMNTLNNLALVHWRLGQVEIAERYWRNYLAFDAYMAQPVAPAQARLNLGMMLLAQGRLDEAMLLLSEALATFERAGSARWQAEALAQFAMLYYRLGDFQGALAHARRAAAVTLDDARSGAGIRVSLGRLLLALDEYEQAGAYFEQAANLMPVTTDTVLAWQIRVERGRSKFKLGRLDDAEEILMEALVALERAGAVEAVARTESLLGEILLRAGDTEQSLELLERALQSQQEIGDLFGELETIERLSRLFESTADAREFEINQRALSLIDQVGSLPLPPLRQAEFRAFSRSVHARQIRLLLRHSRTGEAWQVAMQARGSRIAELQRRHARAVSVDARERLLDRRADLVRQLASARAELAPGDGTVPRAMADLRRQLDPIELGLERLNQPKSDQRRHLALEEVQARLVPGQLLLAWDLLPDLPLLWVVSADEMHVEHVEAVDLVAADIEALVKQLRHPRNALGRIAVLAGRLHDRLLAPAEQMLNQAREVLIMPDSILHSLPFSLLFHFSDSDSGPLVVRNLMSLDLVAHRNRSAIVATTPRMLVFADPGFGDTTSADFPLPEGSLLRRLLHSSSGWQLPGTRAEAEAIATLAGGRAEIELRSGALATREHLLSGAAQQFDVLHLATHGMVDLSFPELSSLLLGAQNGTGPAFVRPHEIAALNLNAELVVLSACETGLGRTFAGSGAFSLARPFLIAGARQVLASLWKVDDHRTALFMQRFYHHLLTESLEPAEALARTQRWMRQQPATAHPYYWAGFVLTAAGIVESESAPMLVGEAG